jgi:hypothetical protein
MVVAATAGIVVGVVALACWLFGRNRKPKLSFSRVANNQSKVHPPTPASVVAPVRASAPVKTPEAIQTQSGAVIAQKAAGCASRMFSGLTAKTLRVVGSCKENLFRAGRIARLAWTLASLVVLRAAYSLAAAIRNLFGSGWPDFSERKLLERLPKARPSEWCLKPFQKAPPHNRDTLVPACIA